MEPAALYAARRELGKTTGKQGQDKLAHTHDPRESGEPAADDLPPAPGHGATPEEWRAWAEVITKAAKSAGYNPDDA